MFEPFRLAAAFFMLRVALGGFMADDQQDDGEVVPLPGSETEAEHQRIRSSNDRDQKLEREGKVSRHNRGYDEAADGTKPVPDVERVTEED
jgi:hypothetical protein